MDLHRQAAQWRAPGADPSESRREVRHREWSNDHCREPARQRHRNGPALAGNPRGHHFRAQYVRTDAEDGGRVGHSRVRAGQPSDRRSLFRQPLRSASVQVLCVPSEESLTTGTRFLQETGFLARGRSGTLPLFPCSRIVVLLLLLLFFSVSSAKEEQEPTASFSHFSSTTSFPGRITTR